MGRYLQTVLVGAVLCAGSATASEIVTCSSHDHEQNYCRVDTRNGVTLVHQLSSSGCWKDDTWGYDRGGIWVANGCRAEFRVGYEGSDYRGSYYHNTERWDDRNRHDDHMSRDDQKAAVGAALAIGLLAAAAANADKHADRDRDNGYGRRVVTCESQGDRHNYCSVSGRFHRAELKRQLSRSSCQYNRSWGYDRSGLWVSSGCRAEFWVD